MKTTILKILASIFLVAAISACDGDKDNDPNPENPDNPKIQIQTAETEITEPVRQPIPSL